MIMDLLPAEAFYDMKTLLFNTGNSTALINVILSVKQFSD